MVMVNNDQNDKLKWWTVGRHQTRVASRLKERAWLEAGIGGGRWMHFGLWDSAVSHSVENEGPLDDAVVGEGPT